MWTQALDVVPNILVPVARGMSALQNSRRMSPFFCDSERKLRSRNQCTTHWDTSLSRALRSVEGRRLHRSISMFSATKAAGMKSFFAMSRFFFDGSTQRKSRRSYVTLTAWTAFSPMRREDAHLNRTHLQRDPPECRTPRRPRLRGGYGWMDLSLVPLLT